MLQELLTEYYKAGIRRAGVVGFTKNGPVNAALREQRERCGFSQAALAEMVGTTAIHISWFELLRRRPPPQLARGITEVLVRKERELFPEITEEQAINEDGLFPSYLRFFVRPKPRPRASDKNGGIYEICENQIGETELEEASRAYLDLTDPPAGVDPVAESEKADMRYQVGRALDSLKERDRRVLWLLSGFNGKPPSYKRIGEEFHVTGSKVRQIEVRALHKLHCSPLVEYIKDYAE